ncbi:hypothetical protein V5799_033912 [Amblyomma americanum]|uniref:Uncharacterized protein n=1 Tax=Amblyomma americanum TaxID=6943 RepID=A0AAQ4DLY6_AMBAM
MKGVPPAAADRGVPYGGAGAAATMQGYFQCATSPVGYATPASRRNWPPTSWRRALFCASTSARTPEPKPAQEFSPRANLGKIIRRKVEGFCDFDALISFAFYFIPGGSGYITEGEERDTKYFYATYPLDTIGKLIIKKIQSVTPG